MLNLFKYLKPYLIAIAAVMTLVFFQAISDLYLPNLMSDIVNFGIINRDIEYIVRTGGFMLLISAGGVMCAVTAGFLSSQISMGFGKILRSRLFTHVSGFSLDEFDRVGTPSLITRNTNDIVQIQMVTMIMMRMMIQAPIICIGGIIMAISKDRDLAWIIAVVVPLVAATVFFVAGRAFPLFQAIQVKLDRINLIVREGLSGIRVIRAFNRIEYEKKRFEIANIDLMETSVKVYRFMSFMMPFMMLLMNLTSIGVIWFGSISIEYGNTDIGDMMAFLQYALQIMNALIMGSMMFIMIPRAQASATRINEVLAIAPGIKDPRIVKSTGRKRGYVDFKNVTFRYHGAEEAAIKNISFSTRPGEVTAIIGSTGSGKSTLVNLIPRFYDVDNGSIEIDGVDVREMSQDALRSKIGLVPQKAVLFTGTIADNIRYGRGNATEAEIKHAAKVAQASEFINALSDGFNSMISQGGTNLSGGQKQRLSIARAIAAKPEIYIFDDSFSALDFKTDAKLRSALRKETKGSTVVIVGQRVATIMDSDRIIVLDDGEVAGMGTHKELYRTCDVYKEIVASQLSEDELA